ncbi:MAG TPA: trypsin-like peptidase domain-containing protein [Acidimicrobiales bacterium]|nr:trypsin-like peptidase domain-containing protein [Acidimicrobiales bacterium]
MEFSTEHDDAEQAEPISPLTPQRNGHSRILLALSALAMVLGAGSLGFIFGHAHQNSTNTVATPGSTPSRFPTGSFGGFGDSGSYPDGATAPSASAPSSAANAAAAKIATSVDPGLVDITTQLSYQQSSAAGTGMIVSSNGLILTNNHVINGATSISVRDVATGKVYKATVVGYDETSDIAVLQLTNASGLTTITTTNNTATKGTSVVGIGNAGGGGGTPSYAAGTVVAVNQSITANDAQNPTGSEALTGMIEFNADIQAGDSGGALVNAKGQVIGMDTAASSNGGPFYGSATTQAYAIPINTALAIATSIENGSGSSTMHIGATAFLGIEVDGSSPSPFAGPGSATPAASGVTVAGTVAGTAAANSALTSGDVIVSVNGQSVTTVTSLDKILQSLKVGDTVRIGYTDTSGAPATLDLVLGSGPPQ